MTRHDDTARLHHILDHAVEAIDVAQGHSRGELDQNRLLNLALVRLLEIVGEAANRVSDETRQQLGSVPWPSIVGLRNRLIHGYDEVDFDILWNIITIDLPPLVEQLRLFLRPSRMHDSG
jgi:uncharacterized protein with HEPN domain